MTPLDFAMTTLLNGIWQGALLATAVWIVLKRIGRVNPTTRFTILWLTLAAVAILPVAPRIPMMVRTPNLRLASAPAAVIDTAAAMAFTPVEVRQPQLVPGLENQSASSSQPTPPFRPEQGAFENIPPSPIAVTERSPIQIRSGKVMAGFAISWGLLSLLLLARLGAGYRLLRRLKSAATPGPEGWSVRWMDLCGTNRVRRQTRFLVSREIATPMSLGFFNPAILIPRSLLETLSEPELDHLVLHELAHLLRYDDWTNLAQKLIEALLPIQPAMFWLGRQMSLEREMACDDWVIAATGRARPYAACLTKVAELSGWQHAGILAAGAAGGRSQLFRRVDHMLDRTRNAVPKLSFLPIAVALVAMIASIYEGTRAPQIVAFAQNSAEAHDQLAPESPQAPIAPRSSEVPAASPVRPTSIAPSVPLAPAAPIAPLASQQNDETHVRITNRNGLTSTNLKIDGAIEFTDDDRDVKSLSPGGRFHLDEGSWFSGRSYDVRADSAGNLTKSYSVGLHEKPLDDDGRAWLAKVLPDIIRNSGIGAGPRVTRILRQGGPQAVLSEIGLIHSDGSRRTYLELLFSQATLSTTQLEDAAKLIQGISSDGDKAQVIIDVDSKYFTDELRPRLFQATDSISSDGDKRKVLSDIARKDAGNPRTLVGVARIAHHISSDGDKAEVLNEIADHYASSDELRAVYFEAVDSISSDGDHARVLLKLLVAHGVDRETMARALRSAGRISSDGDKAGVLIEAVESYTDDESERKAFIDAANSISSDGDHQRALVALVHRQGIAAATLGAIANSAQRISSDGDKAQVLVDLASANIEPVREAFFAAADSIHSDGDRSRVLRAILDKSGTSNAMAIGAIRSATGISSDGDKARVLLDAANRYSNNPAVSSALRQAVESLHSDGEYRAVMTELGRHAGGRSNE